MHTLTRLGYTVRTFTVAGRVVAHMETQTGTHCGRNGLLQRSDLGPTILQAYGPTSREALRALLRHLRSGVTVWYLPRGAKRQRSHVWRLP